MDQFYEIAFSGFLIGVLISAPMGPTGILCIQRTLSKGRWPAFVTGVGAALSDLIYCLLTGLGLSFVTDFIEANQDILQVLGSIAIAGYAAFLFKKKPTHQIKTSTDKKNNFFADLCTGFLFTFANPLILFFSITLFARFNFIQPEYQDYHYIIGYASIVVGALVWWYFITYSVNKVRARFNSHSIWILNRFIATVLFIMAVVGCYMSIKGFIAQYA